MLAQVGRRDRTGGSCSSPTRWRSRIPRRGGSALAGADPRSRTAQPTGDPLAERKADRVHILNLTGEMAGVVWSSNNVPRNPDGPPLAVAAGERVELVCVNQTPMHPIPCLHGHEFQVVEIGGGRFSGAVRDTVLVTPGRRVVVAFDALNPGLWALHCHLLYHLEAGMFTTVKYPQCEQGRPCWRTAGLSSVAPADGIRRETHAQRLYRAAPPRAQGRRADRGLHRRGPQGPRPQDLQDPEGKIDWAKKRATTSTPVAASGTRTTDRLDHWRSAG